MRTWRITLLLFVIALLTLPLPGFTVAQDEDVLPLSGHGPYGVGRTNLVFVDGLRNAREFETVIMYPAVIPEGEDETRFGLHQAEPDSSDAPYPLILYSHWYTSGYMGDHKLFRHLASHGFVVVSIDHKCDSVPTCLIDRPMDVLFVLDQISHVAEQDLAEIVDVDRSGVMGISFGGFTALATAGAQIDPEHFVATDSASRFVPAWDEVVAYRSRFDELIEGELWPSTTDERIQAILPIVSGGYERFGARGLTSVTIPTLMFSSTADPYTLYEEWTVPTFTYLGAEERYLISFIDYGHHPENTSLGAAYYKHFATAFFSYYLQGNEGYAEYLTEDYVEQFEDLAWGVYEEE